MDVKNEMQKEEEEVEEPIPLSITVEKIKLFFLYLSAYLFGLSSSSAAAAAADSSSFGCLFVIQFARNALNDIDVDHEYDAICTKWIAEQKNEWTDTKWMQEKKRECGGCANRRERANQGANYYWKTEWYWKWSSVQIYPSEWMEVKNRDRSQVFM